MRRRLIIRSLLGLLLVAAFVLHVANIRTIPVFERVSSTYYDMRMQITLPDTQDTRIVIVDIDERSLERIGHWPWPRDVVAQLTDRLLDDYRASLIAFDVLFAEPDGSSGLKTLEMLATGPLRESPRFREELENIRPQLEYDRRLAEALSRGETILSYALHMPDTPGTIPRVGALPAPAIAQPPVAIAHHLLAAKGHTASLPELQRGAVHAGFFNNPLIDPDGVHRRAPLLIQYQGKVYESLSLAAVRSLFGMPPVELHMGSGYGSDPATGQRLEWIRIDNFSIPVDERGAVLIPYRGRQGSFPYISASDVLEKRADPSVLSNAIVLIGATATGLLDFRPTPVQNVFPGIEIHANLISGILDQSFKHRPAFARAVELVELIITTLIMILLLPRMPPLAASLLFLGLCATLVGIDLYLWSYKHLAFDPSLALANLVILFSMQMAWGFLVESRGRQNITRLFGQYIPPELVDEMSQHPENYSMGGESRELTVLFSDVRGFTTISEGLTPQQLSQLMNELLTPLTRVIHSHRGTIDKYMGDAIMAFWGAPVPDPHHARHALRAAIEMIHRIEALNNQLQHRGLPLMKMGIGLNTGIMSVGNMGSQFRMAYTVLGDSVNLGSRLEGLTKQYGVDIIVSQATASEVPEFAFRELDRVRVKGKQEPITILEPVCLKRDLDGAHKSPLTRYHAALAAYRNQRWIDAGKILTALAEEDPERLIYRIYLERIDWFREHPPPAGWDGVFTHKSK